MELVSIRGKGGGGWKSKGNTRVGRVIEWDLGAHTAW